MTNKTIYPTFLYVKQHAVTGLKYFGKTIKDPHKYSGSGTRWVRHIKKHGREHVKTIWVSEPYTDSAAIQEFALQFSKENNIVESTDWANLMEENGLDGGGVNGTTHKPHSEEARRKMSASHLGKPRGPHTEATRAKISAANFGRHRDSPTKETRAKMSAASLGKPKSEEHRRNLAKARLGITHTLESRQKISVAKLRRP